MNIVLAILGALAFVSALGVILFRQTIYSALSLVANVGLLAIFFLLLNAQFLFAVQLIIYAGAVMVLFIFIIALLNPRSEDRPLLDWRLGVGILAAMALTAGVFLLAGKNGFAPNGLLQGQAVGGVSDPYHAFAYSPTAVNAAGNVQTVAGQLFTTFLLPFELTALVLFIAAIGAVYLTRHGKADT